MHLVQKLLESLVQQFVIILPKTIKLKSWKWDISLTRESKLHISSSVQIKTSLESVFILYLNSSEITHRLILLASLNMTVPA